MPNRISRRQFVHGSLLGSAAALTVPQVVTAAEGFPALPAPSSKDTLPTGRIGKLEISRLLLGGNLLTHFTHSRDLAYVYRLAARYNTREKIFETMAVAEAHGINTLVIHTATGVLEMLQEYRQKRGGKIKWIICPTAEIHPGLGDYRKQVAQMVDAGVDAIYLWGVRADALTQQGKFDLIAEAVQVVRDKGLPSGVGAHQLEVIKTCEEHKVPADFYIKTLHHDRYPSAKLNHDSSWCANAEEVVQFMRGVTKPWIAFKTMAAGAIHPLDAFRYVIQNGADFVLAGMFDFEIAEDVKIIKKLIAGTLKRERPWIA